jgi:hypothetical protein
LFWMHYVFIKVLFLLTISRRFLLGNGGFFYCQCGFRVKGHSPACNLLRRKERFKGNEIFIFGI